MLISICGKKPRSITGKSKANPTFGNMGNGMVGSDGMLMSI